MTQDQPLDLSLFGDAHVERYQATNGEEGYLWNGAPCLILTTIGRRTGKTYRHALIFGEDDGRYLLVASQGGAPDHPNWYKNLTANPEVELQVRSDVFIATAHSASAEEKAVLWPIMTKIWPSYDKYQERTDRAIPLVVLERDRIG